MYVLKVVEKDFMYIYVWYNLIQLDFWYAHVSKYKTDEISFVAISVSSQISEWLDNMQAAQSL